MKKIRKSISAFLTGITAAMFSISSASAEGGLQESVAYTGTMKMLNDASGALLVAAPVVGIVCVIYFAIRHGAADEMDQKKWKQRIIVAIISVIVAVLAAAIISTITSYYS